MSAKIITHVVNTALAIMVSIALPALAQEKTTEIIPKATDDRCGGFGWNPAVQASVPVAYPLILDLTFDGTLQKEATSLSDTLADSLALSGAFDINGRDMAPVGGAITWISPLAFDYLGWRRAGNWMVVTGTIKPTDDGSRDLFAVSLQTYMTEEGDVLKIAKSDAVLKRSEISAFAGRYVNALTGCITGLPGVLETRILYGKKANKRAVKEIWMTKTGSREQYQVSHDGQLAMLPAWAPGGAFAWTGYRKGNPDIYVDGKAFGTRPGMNTGIAFSPDGVYAALTWAPESASDIYLVSSVTGEIVARLTDSKSINTSPAWSPDSRQIAFVSDRLGFPQIFIMNSDGTDEQPLCLPGAYNTGPDWSPDGSTIIYQSRGKGSRFSIWAYDIHTGTSKQLSRDGYNNEEPSFSPDGRSIVYTSSRGGRKLLFVMNSNGSGARPAFPGDTETETEYFTPAWERMIPIPKR